MKKLFFLLLRLDQEDGRTWQVQWNHDKDKRIVTFIW